VARSCRGGTSWYEKVGWLREGNLDLFEDGGEKKRGTEAFGTKKKKKRN